MLSLHGDGITAPHVFQAVVPGYMGSTDIIEVQGTDPLIAKKSDKTPEYTQKDQTRIVARISVRNIDQIGTEAAAEYTVYGNGRVDVPSGETSAERQHENMQTENLQAGLMTVGVIRDRFGLGS